MRLGLGPLGELSLHRGLGVLRESSDFDEGPRSDRLLKGF